MSESMHSACQFHNDKQWFDKQFHDTEQTTIKKPDELISEIRNPDGKLDETLFDRILGSMIGLLLGDALGAHVEFRPHDFLMANPVTELQGGGTWGLKKGQFTDDTSMALCLAISLVARRDFVPYDQLVRYKWWYRHGYMSSTGLCFDIGSATSQSISEFERRQQLFANEKNIPVEQLDYLSDPNLLKEFNIFCSEEGVAGNGALMRLAPVPLFFYGNPREAVKNSGISGQITHGDQKAYDSCRYFGALIVAALRGETKNDLLSNVFYDNHKDWFNDEPLHPDVLDIAQGSFKRTSGYDDGIRGKGYIINALEAALWAFWSDEDSFEKGALAAVNLGDDTDTTAAIYGGLAGAYYGYNGLPKKWLNDIYAYDFIVCLCKWITYEITNSSNILIETLTDDHGFKSESMAVKPSSPKNSKTYDCIPSIIISAPTTIPSIQCTAIDPLGRLGSLYDGWRDRLIVQSDDTMVRDLQLSVLAKTTKCFLKKGNPSDNLNLLQMTGMTDDLRLSIELNITPTIGIAKTINYALPIDKNTRFIYYNYLDREELLGNNIDDINQSIVSPTSKTKATHIVTGVRWGIEVLAILQLAFDNVFKIDPLLDRIRQRLTDNTTDFDMTSDEKHLLHRINRTTVFSNIHKITKISNIIDLCDKIAHIRKDRTLHSPLTYKLCPIRYLYSEYAENEVRCIPLESVIIEKIESYIRPLLVKFNTLKHLLENKSFESSDEYLRQEFADAQGQFSNVTTTYDRQMKKFQEWIINVRQGKISPNETLDELIGQHQNELQGAINNIIIRLNALKEKQSLVHNSPRIQNETELIKDLHDEKLQSHSAIDDRNESVKYSTDALEKTSDRDSLRNFDNEEYHESALYLADISNLPLRSNNAHVRLSKDDFNVSHRPYSITSQQSSTDSELSSSDTTKETINILLIGEVGVGKSTFINAFANYYSDKTFDDIELQEPVVVIPSSSVINPKDYSAMSIRVQVGTSDSNEKYDGYYHSTTQHCKCYLFRLHDGTNIRFIDTPGLGNLRGWNHDYWEMPNILSFMNNLSHIDAICLLLKPNFSRFSVYESCFQHLFSFFGKQIRQNIIFCFTNSFSTHFDPSDGIRLFQSQLKSTYEHGLRLEKDNTFNFDSEWFRYVAASKYSAELDNELKYQMKSSWHKSKTESIRFVRYIKTHLIPFQIHYKCLSIRHAKLEIQSIIRPILETMRNMLRNYVLRTRNSSKAIIQLHPKATLPNTGHCLLCHSYSDRYENFWITIDNPHKFDKDRCQSCVCSLKYHVSIDYQLDYKSSLDQNNHSYTEMTDILELIKQSAKFANFLRYYSTNFNEDPFLSGIDRMIDEEDFILTHFNQNTLNIGLYHSLKNLRVHYQHYLQELERRQRYSLDLSRLCTEIKHICSLPMMREQMNAVNQSRHLFINEHERQISL